jgi:hypothetical protein
MPAQPPIACTLSAADRPARQAQMTALGRDALLGAAVDDAHAELRFAARPGVRDRVERFAAAEAECCPFLSMAVDAEPGGVVLTIDGPDAARPVLLELVAAFRDAPAIVRRRRR